MSASTNTKRLQFANGYRASISSATSLELYQPSPAETPTFPRPLSRFGLFAAPIAAIAMYFAPTQVLDRRIYSVERESLSPIFVFNWNVFDDHWRDSEAWVSQAEIDELNRLFAISPPAGFSLDLRDA